MEPATLAEFLEGEVSLSVAPSSVSYHLPDGGLDPGPWKLTLHNSTPGCHSFEGEALFDGEPLEQTFPGGYILGGFPPSNSCYGPRWNLPKPLPDTALSTIVVRDETAEATLTTPRLGAVRRPFLAEPDGGVLLWGGSFSIGWTVPEDERVSFSVQFTTDAGLLLSTAFDTLEEGVSDGGLTTFYLPDGGEAVDAEVLVFPSVTAAVTCTPASLECYVQHDEEPLVVPVQLR